MGHLSDSQEEIAEALSSVTGLQGHKHAPSVLRSGIGFSRFVAADSMPAPGVFEVSWEICVIAGSTPLAALSYLDEHQDEIVDALLPVVYVRSIQLSEFTSGGEPLFGITITSVKE